MKDESGTIKSPLYPKAYPANADCEWIINVPVTKIIHVSFTNVDLSQKTYCFEYVNVFDGLWTGKVHK